METVNVMDLDESYIGRCIIDVGIITKVERFPDTVHLTCGRSHVHASMDFLVLLEDPDVES